MGTEIERKFLVDPSKLPDLSQETTDHLEQFYLARDPWVRVRILNRAGGRLTIKGPGTLSRAEFEYPIPVEDAVAMRPMGKGALTKTRYNVPAGNGLMWEIDRFHEPFQLWLAEIELDSPDQAFERPAWITKEVTEDFRYSNAVLVEIGAPTPCDLSPVFDLIRGHLRPARYEADDNGIILESLTFLRQVTPKDFDEASYSVGIASFQRMNKREQEAVVREAFRR